MFDAAMSLAWSACRTKGKLRAAAALSAIIIAGRRLSGNRDNHVLAKRRDVWFDLDLSEGIDLAMFLGMYEINTYRALRQMVIPGDTVIDIGANVGAHTLPLAHLVGVDGRVVAVEPTQWAFNRLLVNLQLNHPLQRQVLPVHGYLHSGHDSRKAPLDFYSSWRLTGPGKRHPSHGGLLASAGGAAQHSLDSLVAELGLARIDVIKLDVDGYECDVLRGGEKTIRRFQPWIVCELCPSALAEHGASLDQLCGLIAEHGYVFRDEANLRPLANDVAALNASIKPGSGINVLAVPRTAITHPMRWRGHPGPRRPSG